MHYLKIIGLICLIAIRHNIAWGQAAKQYPKELPRARNAVYISSLSGLSYERFYPLTPTRTIGFGIGGITRTFRHELDPAIPKFHLKWWLASLSAFYALSSLNQRHHLEFSFLYLYQEQENIQGTVNQLPSGQSVFNGYTHWVITQGFMCRIGWRRQIPKHGLFWRLGIVPIYYKMEDWSSAQPRDALVWNRWVYTPALDVSIGYSF